MSSKLRYSNQNKSVCQKISTYTKVAYDFDSTTQPR